MKKGKRFISFILLTVFLIVIGHNILPAHHHDIPINRETHYHAHHHDNGHTHSHHHHSSSSLWDLIRYVLEKIPHSDTENQSQQTFIKQIQKQAPQHPDKLPTDFVLSDTTFFDIANEVVLLHLFEPKDPVPLYIKNGIHLRAPPFSV